MPLIPPRDNKDVWAELVTRQASSPNAGTAVSEDAAAGNQSRRDLFAAAALQGLCAEYVNDGVGWKTIAAQSVLAADALIAELAK
jgi:hypothetical protein